MHLDTIRVAFTLRLNDGRVYQISHPDYIAVSRREVYVVDATTDQGIFLEPVLIASLESGDSAWFKEG